MQGAPMKEDEKAGVRATVFRHLSGIVLAPTVKALWDRKVFDLFDSVGKLVGLDEVVEKTGGNRGYVRVALRLLSSAGWLTQHLSANETKARYALTQEGAVALKFAPQLYGEVVSFVPKAVFLEDFLYGNSDEPILPSLREFVSRAKERWGIQTSSDASSAQVCEQVRHHLEGMLIGPAMVALARGGVLAQLEHGAVKLSEMGNQASLACIFDLLATQGWVVREQNAVSLTACGRYAAQIATSYGVTVSYLPTFNVVSTLLFGNPRIPRMDDSGVELLVNRGMNVWGSGGAHKTYFKKVDEIIIEIFNRPLEHQPRGICDMGCGDGSFLEHLYNVVKNQTARGPMLDKNPLIIIGADFNKVARRVAKQMLRKAGIPTFQVIHGDINRPALLAGDLEQLGLDIHDLLHVRSFLDHNRPYLPPGDYVKGSRSAKSTGAFSHFGQEVLPDELEENLVRHLRRWAPYVGRFGLLTLELHTLPPELTAANLERTPAVAYDGTHGFSDQYLVELPVFLDCVREAGLKADPRYQAKFPPSDLATVSINFLTTRN
jgi:hypothetical protein